MAENDLTILITGFGVRRFTSRLQIIVERELTDWHHNQEFQNIKNNPSWEIVSQLPSKINHKAINISIIAYPEPLKAEYHHLIDIVPKLIEKFKPDVVIHIGLADDQKNFTIERGAERNVYHQYPDEKRKVFTKSETKELWGKSPSRLNSTLDLDGIQTKWRAQVGKAADVNVSDDVGSYVCGLIYYTSLEYFWRKKTGEMPVVFMHVPQLQGKTDIELGVSVTLGLVRAVAETCRKWCKDVPNSGFQIAFRTEICRKQMQRRPKTEISGSSREVQEKPVAGESWGDEPRQGVYET